MIDATVSKKDIERIKSKLKNVDASTANNVLFKAFRKGSIFVEGQLISNIRGKYLNVRVGKLWQSIGSRVTAGAGGYSSVIGSGVRTGKRMVYANIHETGGTITPKEAKYLTIPVGEALTPAGALRFDARQAIDDGAFFYESNAGNLLIGKKKGDKITTLFILKRKVNIPKSGYLSKTLQFSKTKFFDILVNGIDEGLKK